MDSVQFRKSDPKAPRFREEVYDIASYSNKPFFAAIKKQYPALKKYTSSDIFNCIKLFNTRISAEVINNRNGVRLPEGLGIIVAGACNVHEVYKPDVKASAEAGVTIPHQNLHSDSYIAQVKYSNDLDKHMFDNHELWGFDACRNLARGVSAEFKKGNHKNYIVFTTRQHIAHLFRKQKIEKESVKSAAGKKDRLDNHDEFAFE